MRALKSGVCAALLITVPAAAIAGGPVLQPVPTPNEVLRFAQGVPTLDMQGQHGAVQVTPLPMDHGSYAFTIAVYNHGAAPANIDVTNIDVLTNGQHYAAFSRSDLEHKAKHRAMWASIALAAAGGLAAAAAANQRDHYSATTYTPHGTYRTFISAPSQAGQVEAVAAAASAGVGIAAIQTQLDRTREALGATTVQMTTVDPGDSYAGRVVIAKLKTATLPQHIDFIVNWNGEAYPFAFQLAKSGTPQPVFAPPPPRDLPPVAPDVAAPQTPVPMTPAAQPS